MESQSSSSMHGSGKREMWNKNKDMVKPLLSKLASGDQRSSSMSMRRLRHCHSSPGLDVTSLEVKPWGISAKPSFGTQDSRSTVLVAASVFVTYLGAGIIIFYAVENELKGEKTNSFVDALYFCIVTLTTVGYGDLVPAGVLAKLFTCIFVFVGFGLVGLLLGSAANFLFERQEIALMNALSDKTKPDYSEFKASHRLKKVRFKVAIAGSTGIVCFLIGLVVLILVEKMNFLEAFYCVCVTVTTLGYGDISFHTLGGRIFAVIWILLSTINLAQFFLYVAELYTEVRSQSFLRWVLSRKTTFSDLEAADMDNDGVVSAAEFVVYKLKELGKVEEEDITDILREFDSLDVDDSGTLSPFDLTMAQTTDS